MLKTMKDDNINEIQHPSFGLISVSRVTMGTGHPMCGTDMMPTNVIRIRINRNCIQENNPHLGRRVYMGHNSYNDRVEVEMTYSQFSNLICTMNHGDGTPCNIINYGPDGEIPQFREHIDSEFEAQLNNTKQKLKNQHKYYEDARQKISELIEKLPKSKQADILKVINNLEATITDSVPFFMSQVEEAASDIVARAKNEISHYMDVAVNNIGIKTIVDKSEKNGQKFLSTDFDFIK